MDSRELTYKVVEQFESINGEGTRAGQLALFVRFQGCNLNCSYCDTQWANKADTAYTNMSVQEIADHADRTGITNITLTGGEPLLQKDIEVLINELTRRHHRVEIETNGSVDLRNLKEKCHRDVTFTMDYKLGCSGMESHMCLENFSLLGKNDTVKFVSGSVNDLNSAREIIERYHLTNTCNVYISPVFGSIELPEIVEFMKVNKMNDVNMQIQMHKVIWDPMARGV